MQRTSFTEMTCPVARTADIIGEWWTPLILRDIAIGVTRFDAIQRDLGISRKVLTDRLAALVEHGILQRSAYQEKPTRYDYFLTEKGADLASVILAMQAWGNRWIFGKEAAPIVMRHLGCGEIVDPVMTCSHCGEELRAGEVLPEPGPGFPDDEDNAEVAAALERIRVAREAAQAAMSAASPG